MSPRLGVSLRAAGVRRGDKWVLRGITWQIKPGERWALLGENGAGKTQLLKLLSGDVWPTPTRATAAVRSYRAGRQAVDLLDAKPRIAYLGGERQDKYARYAWNLRVREVIATGLHRTDLLLSPVTRTEAKQVAAMLRTCGYRATRCAGIPVPVLRRETLGVAGAGTGATAGLAVARRGVQRPGSRVSAANRLGAGGGARQGSVMDCDGASRDGRAGRYRIAD